MAGPPQGYRDIPEEDRRKAKSFFEKAATVAGTGNYEYGIELYMQGLSFDPESVEAHQALRDVSLRRKATGGKSLGMFETMKMKTVRDDKQKMLNAEKALAHEPGDTSQMQSLMEAAHRMGYYDTVMWIAPLLMRANIDMEKKQELSKFLAVRDIYTNLSQFRLAAEAAQFALSLKPEDMDLQRQVRELGAKMTMSEGNYSGTGDFRGSIRNREEQEKLQRQDADIRTEDAMAMLIRDAEAEWKASPDEPGKITKYVDVLVKTDNPELENRAIEILEAAHKRTGQYRYRLRVDEIRIRQLNRMARSMRDRVKKNPSDKQMAADYTQFLREKNEEELAVFTRAAEAYPTQLDYQFNMATRLFQLERFGEAIPVFQRARNDPKYRTEASVWLGKSFLEAGFSDEAVDTLKDIIDTYQLRGDEKSIEMTYWYGRSLEVKGDMPAAIKAYSQVAQWSFTYKDVQQRIKTLRAAAT